MARYNDRFYASDAGNRRPCNENQVIVVVDRFSKYAILIPLRTDNDTEVIFQLLWGKVLTITSDRDKIFRSEKMDNVDEIVEMPTNIELGRLR